MQSGAVRALQGQLKPYDEMLDTVGNEIMGQLAANASPLDLAKAEILGTKISDKYARDHPAAAMILKTGKIQLLQMLEAGQIPGLAGEVINKGQPVTKVTGPLG
jgi:DNA-binding FrmR family transcriptional regulator